MINKKDFYTDLDALKLEATKRGVTFDFDAILEKIEIERTVKEEVQRLQTERNRLSKERDPALASQESTPPNHRQAPGYSQPLGAPCWRDHILPECKRPGSHYSIRGLMDAAACVYA